MRIEPHVQGSNSPSSRAHARLISSAELIRLLTCTKDPPLAGLRTPHSYPLQAKDKNTAATVLDPTAGSEISELISG
jgi:hypothetical protein